MKLDLVVARRGLDPAAETCEHALRDLLCLDVVGVERACLWRFEVPAADGAPALAAVRSRLERAACYAGRYVNLNRDACTWPDGPRPLASGGFDGTAVDVWVRDGDGRDVAALAWFRAQAEPALGDLWRGTLWRLLLPEPDPDAARDRALEIAVTRARRSGLLANPQAQTAEVLHVVRASKEVP